MVEMADSQWGFVPQYVPDAETAFATIRQAGAAILRGTGDSRDAARDVAMRVLAPLSPVVPDPAPIKEGGGNKDQTYRDMPGAEAGPAVPFQSGHTDGFAYGDRYPDFIFLLCVRPAKSGGESFVVDSYKMLDALATSASDEDRAFHAFLTTEPIEQTEPTFQSSLAPAVGDNGKGRRMTRWSPIQRPNPALAADVQARHAGWLERWKTMTYEASRNAPRFTLQPGETICLDNYRMLHGRTGFDDTERALWRIWAWTTEAPAVPDGMLFSDSRYAVVT